MQFLKIKKIRKEMLLNKILLFAFLVAKNLIMGLFDQVGASLFGGNQQNSQGYPQQQQGYPQQNYPQQGYQQNNYQQGYQDPNQQYNNGPIAPLGTGTFKLMTDKELYCKAQGDGMFFAKKGSMVAFTGNMKFSKRLLGTNGGNVVGQLLNHAARKITGENLEIMEVKGSGVCYLADLAAHVTVIDLEGSGPWQSVCVESEDLLAFTPQCHYGVTPIGVGVISQKGLFTSKLTYTGPGAQVAIKTNGNPLVLQAPCKVDPDAMVAFTGAAPKVKLDVNFKTLIGQTSGESYMLEFTEPGQLVIVQPYERESGFSLKDTNRPTTQAGPRFGAGGSSGAVPGANTQDVGGAIGNMIGGLFN